MWSRKRLTDASIVDQDVQIGVLEITQAGLDGL